MTTIYLYGELADKFGREWTLDVSSVGEAIRAIETNKPGIIAYLDESGTRGVDFNVKVNEIDQTSEDELRCTRRIDTIKISPVVRGSKDGITRVIIGVVLIIVAVFSMQPELMGPGVGLFGSTQLATMVGMMGVSLAIGGVASMLAGDPKTDTAAIDDGESPSDNFNGPENTTTQGAPVPLCYGGPILVGSRVISAGIHTDDTSYYANGVYDSNGVATGPTIEYDLKNVQRVQIMDLICEGEVAGLCDQNGNGP